MSTAFPEKLISLSKYNSGFTGNSAELEHCLNMIDHVQTVVETWSRNMVDHVSNVSVKWLLLPELWSTMVQIDLNGQPCFDNGAFNVNG